YKEEPRVVRQTLLAAALQQYPRRRVVLLIDDPPAPGNREEAARLETARTLPRELEALFAEPCGRFERALAGYIVRRANGSVDPRQAVERLAAALRETADGLDGVPDADFIVVLDADSLILAEYTLRLVHLVTRPGNERVAVVQTPYASVPGATSAIERIAGATTDVQLMTHQGATLFGAGSWVGASALVRRAALDDIVFTTEERGYPISCYVRDRTLNEDTDTTVDLIRGGWTVQNYPDRLAYSATPPDFGSLLIQRRRW